MSHLIRLAVFGLLLVIPVVIWGCGREKSSHSASHTSDVKKVDYSDTEILAYKNWQRMTETPHIVDIQTASYCRAVTPDDLKIAREKYGPHADASVHIYLNTIAANDFPHATAWPVGSVIIKEKYGMYSDATPDGSRAAGGMIKREAGYDPDNGDWQYFYIEAGETVIKRQGLENCASCHASAETDYVFGSWAPVNR